MQRNHWLSASFLVVCGAAAFALSRSAQAPDQAEMDGKMQAFATPGEGHKVLDSKVGKWNLGVKMWMAPGMEPIVSKGTSEMKWILDGRFIQDDTNGEFMGSPFIGRGVQGYDNLKKKYVTSWIDNMGTCILSSEGTYDPTKKTFTFQSESPDVMAGKYVKNRIVVTNQDRDHFAYQQYGPGPDGKEFLTMELTYERAK